MTLLVTSAAATVPNQRFQVFFIDGSSFLLCLSSVSCKQFTPTFPGVGDCSQLREFRRRGAVFRLTDRHSLLIWVILASRSRETDPAAKDSYSDFSACSD